jgi:lipoprotein NlpI
MDIGFKAVSILIVLLASGCASVNRQSEKSQMGNILIAEPVAATIRSQTYVLRYTRILEKAPLEDRDRADLLFQRGLQYDKLGLPLLAQVDFQQAVSLKPDMAAAYNSIGIHYTQQGKYLQAYEEFDSALDINPDFDFAFLNRGIALYYGGRPELAVQDFKVFYDRDQSDPIRAIWQFLAESKFDSQQATENLEKAKSSFEPNNWNIRLVDFFLGELSEKELLSALPFGVTNPRKLAERTCEVYFYLGKYHSALDNRGAAMNYFRFALTTNVYDYVEHRYARLELNILRDSTSQYPRVQ